MEQQIINAIIGAIPGTEVRCFETTGGWVVEAINPNFNNEGVAEGQVYQALHGIPPGPTPIIFWKIFVYSEEVQAFTVQATLHTRDADYDENGFQTTYLEANDCYLNITEYDAEILQLGDYNNLAIEGLESLGRDGNPLLPYQAGTRHRWLETLGGQYHLVDKGPTRLVDGGAHPYRVEIQLGAHDPVQGRQ